MPFICHTCNNQFEGNVEKSTAIVNGQDSFIKVIEKAYECPSCNTISNYETVEEVKMRKKRNTFRTNLTYPSGGSY